MKISVADLSYTWINDWAQVSPGPGFAHHGIAVLGNGDIATGHATDATVQILRAPDPSERSLIPGHSATAVRCRGIRRRLG
jgi:hypothetical protein